MAFASTITETNLVFGSKKIVYGTYTNGAGDSGGDISTGLSEVQFFWLQPTGAAVIASQPTVNETLPLNGGDVTVVNTLDEDGVWMAIGK